MKKPPQEQKEAVITEDVFQAILDNSDECFSFLVRFLWMTGCRPQEADIKRHDRVPHC